MKTFVHIGWLLIALGVAGMLTGCASYRSHQAARAAAKNFEVVETNTKRLLTPEEMTYLRLAVAKYLEKEGAVANGDYYVKVFLAPDKDGLSSEWVVVRFTRDTEMRYALVGSYPANSYNTRSYASYDYYPYGYDHFGRISFQYYYDPYYGSHYYFPPRNRHNHNRDRDHNRNKDRDDDNPRSADRPKFKPIPPVGSPGVTRTSGDADQAAGDNQRRENNFPRHGGTPVRQTGRQFDRSADNRPDTPTISPARSEAPRSESVRNNQPREGNFPRHGGAPVRQSERQSEPRRESVTSSPVRSESPAQSSNYSAPAARSESSHSSGSNQSQREANEAAAQRERVE